MLAPVDDPRFKSLVQRLHGAADIPDFFAAVKAILDQAMPHHRTLSSRERALLHVLSPHIEATARKLNATRVAESFDSASPTRTRTPELERLLWQLTRAERDIVLLVMQGWSNKEVASKLRKSVRTVKTQLTTIYKKYHVRSRGRLLAKLSESSDVISGGARPMPRALPSPESARSIP